jgi:hypothetical protein
MMESIKTVLMVKDESSLAVSVITNGLDYSIKRTKNSVKDSLYNAQRDRLKEAFPHLWTRKDLSSRVSRINPVLDDRLHRCRPGELDKTSA